MLIHLKSLVATVDDMVTGEKKFFNFQQVKMTFYLFLYTIRKEWSVYFGSLNEVTLLNTLKN